MVFKNYGWNKENERKEGGKSSNLEANDVNEKIMQSEMYNLRLFNTKSDFFLLFMNMYNTIQYNTVQWNTI